MQSFRNMNSYHKLTYNSGKTFIKTIVIKRVTLTESFAFNYFSNYFSAACSSYLRDALMTCLQYMNKFFSPSLLNLKINYSDLGINFIQ